MEAAELEASPMMDRTSLEDMVREEQEGRGGEERSALRARSLRGVFCVQEPLLKFVGSLAPSFNDRNTHESVDFSLYSLGLGYGIAEEDEDGESKIDRRLHRPLLPSPFPLDSKMTKGFPFLL